MDTNSRRTVAGESLLSGAMERSGMEALRMLRSGDAVNISDTGKHQASSGSGCPEEAPGAEACLWSFICFLAFFPFEKLMG